MAASIILVLFILSFFLEDIRASVGWNMFLSTMLESIGLTEFMNWICRFLFVILFILLNQINIPIQILLLQLRKYIQKYIVVNMIYLILNNLQIFKIVKNIVCNVLTETNKFSLSQDINQVNHLFLKNRGKIIQ